MMSRPAALCWLLGLGVLAGCSREQTIDCEPTERYSTARSVSPVQIPDDLSPPDESDALRLPPIAGTAAGDASRGCLEEPPPFARGVRPGTAPAETPAGNGAQAEQQNPERQIDN